MASRPTSRAAAEIKALAKKHSKAAIKVLAAIMNQADGPATARVSAAQALLDRGWGKAAQPVAGEDGGVAGAGENRTGDCRSRAKKEQTAAARSRSLKIDTPRVFLPLLAPARYKGAYGGRGSGKSHFFAELLIEDCLCERGILAVSSHEMIHLRQHLTGDREHHGPRFKRMAARVCAVHGFDPKIF